MYIHSFQDNIEIKNKGYLSSQKNFLCDVRGYDFINEFVPRFFKCFDSHNRSSLEGEYLHYSYIAHLISFLFYKWFYFLELYHRNAIFTFSFNYIIAQMTSQNFKRISKYRENCRNILRISDLSRAHTSIHLGANQIMQVFFQLPSTRHDLLTVNTDTMIYNVCIILFWKEISDKIILYRRMPFEIRMYIEINGLTFFNKSV